MGQRTQVFVELEGKDKQGNNIYKNFLFHQQWGLGRGLTDRLMQLMFALRQMSYQERQDGFNVAQVFKRDHNIFQEMKEYVDIQEVEKLKNSKIELTELKDLMLNQDNNDGYLVVRLRNTMEDTSHYSFSNFKITEISAGIYSHDLEYMDPVDYLVEYQEPDKYVNFVKSYIDLETEGENSLIEDVLKTWDK